MINKNKLKIHVQLLQISISHSSILSSKKIRRSFLTMATKKLRYLSIYKSRQKAISKNKIKVESLIMDEKIIVIS